MAQPGDLAARAAGALAVKHRLTGAAVLRIGLGGLVGYRYLSAWPVRHFLWGPSGLLPIEAFGRTEIHAGPSVFAVGSDAAFDALYLTGLLVSLAFLAGWRTRVVSVPFVAFTWSLFSRNPLALNAADNLVAATLPYLLLMDLSARLSLDARRPRTGPDRPAAARLHNAGLLCLVVQLGIVYAASFIFKLLGTTWRDGSALGIVFGLAEYRPPVLSDFLTTNEAAQMVLARATMAFEATYPLLLWSRRTSWAAAAGAAVFHTGTILLMGLAAFGFTMIVFQAVVLTDEQYRSLGRRLGWPAPVPQPGTAPDAPAHHSAFVGTSFSARLPEGERGRIR